MQSSCECTTTKRETAHVIRALFLPISWTWKQTRRAITILTYDFFRFVIEYRHETGSSLGGNKKKKKIPARDSSRSHWCANWRRWKGKRLRLSCHGHITSLREWDSPRATRNDRSFAPRSLTKLVDWRPSTVDRRRGWHMSLARARACQGGNAGERRANAVHNAWEFSLETHRCVRCCSTIGPSSSSLSARRRRQRRRQRRRRRRQMTAVSGRRAAVHGGGHGLTWRNGRMGARETDTSFNATAAMITVSHSASCIRWHPQCRYTRSDEATRWTIARTRASGERWLARRRGTQARQFCAPLWTRASACRSAEIDSLPMDAGAWPPAPRRMLGHVFFRIRRTGGETPGSTDGFLVRGMMLGIHFIAEIILDRCGNAPPSLSIAGIVYYVIFWSFGFCES